MFQLLGIPGTPYVIDDCSHHVTQRGNRRRPTFFGDPDYELYRTLLAAACNRNDVAVWAYCLMPNHVHLVLVPGSVSGLRLALGETHQRYAGVVNRRQGWVGHLWQGRFASCALDGPHLVAAVRYVELNPVRARLADRAEDWPWSSARAHLAGRDNGLVAVAPLLDAIDNWSAFLAVAPRDRDLDALRRHERTGRPLGGSQFVAELERGLGRRLRPGRPGRRGKEQADGLNA